MYATQATELRPDVRAAVQAQIIASLPTADWSDYERAKRAISAVCGWYAATPELTDDQQYAMALRAYMDAVHL